MTGRTVLVTGGSGFLGMRLAHAFKVRGDDVLVLDVIDSEDRPSDIRFIQGDVRDESKVRSACEGIAIVIHAVAKVPLARDRREMEDVNVNGTRNLLRSCIEAGVEKVVHISTSAIYGVPESNPVTEATPAKPAEAYGRAKLRAEGLCKAASSQGLDVTIVRPRTIVGPGRLGIFSLLFDWIADDVDIFVLGNGDNVYQFIHVDDAVDACIRASATPGADDFNVGSAEFGSMRDSLQGLIAEVGSSSRVRRLPLGPAAAAMKAGSFLGLTPFAAYHWLMYGRSMYFDCGKAGRALGWQPKYSNQEMLVEAFRWYSEHRSSLFVDMGSEHRSPVRQGVLGMWKWISRSGKERR